MKKILFSIILIPLLIFSNTSKFSSNDNPKKITLSKDSPIEILGNWFNPKINFEWVCGIYDNTVIYKNDIWEIDGLIKNQNIYKLSISNSINKLNLFVKTIDSETLLVGEEMTSLNTLLSKKKNNKIQSKKTKGSRTLPVFNKGTVHYKGYIKGFKPEFDRTLKIHIPNIVTGKTDEFQFKIEDDGTFNVDFPIQLTTIAYVRNKHFEEKVLFQANTLIVQFIDINNHNKNWSNNLQKKQRVRNSLFMGSNSILNNELKLLESIDYFDSLNDSDTILSLDLYQYKAYCLKNAENELDSLSNKAKLYYLTSSTEQIKVMDIQYKTAIRILDYELKLNKAQRKHRIQTTEKELVYPHNFFGFLNPQLYNDSSSILTGHTYDSFIKRLNTGGPMQQKGYLNYFNHLSSLFIEYEILLDKQEKEMLEKLKQTESELDFQLISNNYKNTWLSFQKTYEELIQDAKYKAIYDVMSNNREKYFKLSNLTRELIYSQTEVILSSLKLQYFSESAISNINKNIHNVNIKDILIDFDNQRKQKLNAAKNEIRELKIFDVSDIQKDKLIDEILSHHKGKIVIFDFWATWCAPCLNGMEQSKPFKTQSKYKNIEFVYLTNHTSPESQWKKLIQSIGGNHYRLTPEQWKYISDKYDITGIPRYFFADKNGVIINENIGHPFISETSKKLINKYVN